MCRITGRKEPNMSTRNLRMLQKWVLRRDNSEYFNLSSFLRPVKKPFSWGKGNINAAVASSYPEWIVPVSSVNGIIPVKIHDMGYVLIFITAVICRSASHGLGGNFQPDRETSFDCRGFGETRWNSGLVDNTAAFPGIQHLFSYVDSNQFLIGDYFPGMCFWGQKKNKWRKQYKYEVKSFGHYIYNITGKNIFCHYFYEFSFQNAAG